MAFTITYKEDKGMVDKCSHGFKLVTGSVAFDASYPTGGEPMDMSKVFPTELHLVLFEAAYGFVFKYEYANKKVVAYYYDYNAANDGQAIQVPDTTDLSALTQVCFLAVGK
jgi:hypothetical protein